MKVRIKNVTGSTSNEWLLWELKKEARVKEGDIVEGKFNPKNKHSAVPSPPVRHHTFHG